MLTRKGYLVSEPSIVRYFLIFITSRSSNKIVDPNNEEINISEINIAKIDNQLHN